MRDRRPWASFASRGIALAVAIVACAAPKAKADGAACHEATECEDGLACVPKGKGERVCSRDVTGLGEPPEVAAPDAGTDGDAIEAGAPADAAADHGGVDAGAGDAPAE